ncbi:MAG: TIM barrel protein [Candidatus Bathyarchaeia archaeon]
MKRPLNLIQLEKEFQTLRSIGDDIGYSGPIVDELHFALCALGEVLPPHLKKMGYVLYPSRKAMGEVSDLAERYGIRLGGHGSHLINLASVKKSLRRASKGHITALMNRMEPCGGIYGVIHVGYWKGVSHEKAERFIVSALDDISGALPLPLALEVVGSPKAIGPLDFLIDITNRYDRNITVCVDFAHIHATTNGSIRNKETVRDILLKLKERLGSRLVVVHVSDIEWSSEVGEVKHVPFGLSDLNYKAVIETIAEETLEECVVVCESPKRVGDTRAILETLKPVLRS